MSAPALVLDLGAALPGWVVRLAAPLLVVLCATLTDGGPVVWTVAGTVAAVVAVRPALPTAALVPVLAGTWLLGRADLLDGDPGRALRLAALVLVVHLAVRLGTFAAHVTWAARVEAAVLRRLVAGALRVQVAVQVLLLATFTVRAATDGVTASVLRVVTVPLAVLLVLAVLPRAWVRR